MGAFAHPGPASRPKMPAAARTRERPGGCRGGRCHDGQPAGRSGTTPRRERPGGLGAARGAATACRCGGCLCFGLGRTATTLRCGGRGFHLGLRLAATTCRRGRDLGSQRFRLGRATATLRCRGHLHVGSSLAATARGRGRRGQHGRGISRLATTTRRRGGEHGRRLGLGRTATAFGRCGHGFHFGLRFATTTDWRGRSGGSAGCQCLGLRRTATAFGRFGHGFHIHLRLATATGRCSGCCFHLGLRFAATAGRRSGSGCTGCQCLCLRRTATAFGRLDHGFHFRLRLATAACHRGGCCFHLGLRFATTTGRRGRSSGGSTGGQCLGLGRTATAFGRLGHGFHFHLRLATAACRGSGCSFYLGLGFATTTGRRGRSGGSSTGCQCLGLRRTATAFGCSGYLGFGGCLAGAAHRFGNGFCGLAAPPCGRSGRGGCSAAGGCSSAGRGGTTGDRICCSLAASGCRLAADGFFRHRRLAGGCCHQKLLEQE